MATNANAIRAGRAFVELFADDRALVRGLRGAEKRLKSFGTSIARLGAVVTGFGTAAITPLLVSAQRFSTIGDEVDKASKRLGTSAEFVSEMGFAAGQSGTSLEGLERSIRAMQRGIVDAQKDTGSLAEALGVLGVQLASVTGKSTEEQFELLATAVARIENDTLRAAIAMKVFGKAGAELLPLLAEGPDGIARLRDEARRLGLSMSGRTAQSAADLNDALDRMKQSVSAISLAVGGALAPSLSKLADAVANVSAAMTRFIKQHEQLVVVAGLAAAATVFFGSKLAVLGVALRGIGVTFGLVATLVSGIGAVLAFLISPLGLVTAALVAGAAAFLYYSGTGAKAIAYLMERFGELRVFVGRVVAGIASALAAGDISLAVEILWLSIQVAFQKGVAQVLTVWANFKAFFLRIWNEAVHGLAAAFINAYAGLRQGWALLTKGWRVTVDFIEDSWTVVWTGMVKLFNNARAEVLKGLLSLKKAFAKFVKYDPVAAALGFKPIVVDVPKETAKIDQQLAEANQAADANFAKTFSDREAARRQEQSAEDAHRRRIEDERKQALGDIERARQEQNAAIQSGQDAAIRQAEARLARARARLQSAISHANALKPEEKLAEEKRGDLAGLAATAGGGVRGTFSGLSAMRALATDATTRKLDEIVAELKELNGKTEEGGLVFGGAGAGGF